MKKIHLVFKTHLDLGYTDYADTVERLYRDNFIPKAIKLAKEVNTDRKRFIWTTGAWLIENALKFSSKENAEELDSAIKRGDIVPHGLPFTMHSELLDKDTFRYGLDIGRKLKEKYGLNILSGKMTDVPGHTGAIVPLLAEYGIKLLHIGVNEASAVPDVPEAFVWKYAGAEIVVLYEGTYGSLYKNEFIDDILYFAHTSDNRGPIDSKSLLKLYSELEKEYPGYEITASTLDAYAEAILKVKDKLPIVTSEIGDSWIHGSASDPYKSAALRELMALKRKWLETGEMARGSREYDAFSNCLLMLSEHTCGMDVKKHLSDLGLYLKKDFKKCKDEDRVRLDYTTLSGTGLKIRTAYLRMKGEYLKGSYRRIEGSWAEQRRYIEDAVKALAPERKKEAEAHIKKLIPEDTGFQLKDLKAAVAGKPYESQEYKITFNEGGAISELKYKGATVLSGNLPAIDYTSYGAKDYDYWIANYSRDTVSTKFWLRGDFARPLLEQVDGKYPQGVFPYKLIKLYQSENKQAKFFLAKLSVDEELSDMLGAPRIIEILYSFKKDTFKVGIEVMWLNKDESRLTESTFLHFNVRADENSVRYIKIGAEINPLDIVKNGNRNLAAVQELSYSCDGISYIIKNYHSPLVSIGKGKILKFDNVYGNPAEGISFNLHNNVWGTNFPLWYGDNAYFAYEITPNS